MFQMLFVRLLLGRQTIPHRDPGPQVIIPSDTLNPNLQAASPLDTVLALRAVLPPDTILPGLLAVIRVITTPFPMLQHITPLLRHTIRPIHKYLMYRTVPSPTAMQARKV